MRSRLPLIALSVAILLVAGIFGWAGWRSADYLYELMPQQDPLRDYTQREYITTATRIETDIRALNELLTTFIAQADRSTSNRFIQTSAQFQSWIDSQQSNSKIIVRGSLNYSRDTADLLSHVKLAIEAYLAAARDVLAATNPSSALLENDLLLKTQSHHLTDASALLRYKAETIGISAASWKKVLLTVVVLLILLLPCAWLAFRLYRAEILPLHRRLDEHAAVIEKQKKLAHFGELAAGLAHEIRNPLTAINARLFTLQRALLPRTPAHEDALVIRNEISRLDRVVGDFLKLARPADPELVTVTAAPILREVVDLLTPDLLDKNIKLTLGATIPAPFQGDPLQLKQVLINLVKNAGESIGHDGVITLRARTGTETIKGLATEAIILEVEDTGSGDSGPRRKSGSSNHFTVPRKTAPAWGFPSPGKSSINMVVRWTFRTSTTRAASFESYCPARKEPDTMPRVLLIEDDKQLAESLQHTLQDVAYEGVEDYSVDMTDNATQGLALAKEQQYDVVVTDLHLPNRNAKDTTDGLTIITTLHAAKPQLPIILMTGDETTRHAIEAIKLGASEYILKGGNKFLMDNLLTAIHKAVTSHRMMSESIELGAATTAKHAIIGRSHAMQQVYKDIGRLAATPVTVLIRGETGTGKELVARAAPTRRPQRSTIYCHQLRRRPGTSLGK